MQLYRLCELLRSTYEECMQLPVPPHEDRMERQDSDDETDDRPTDWPGDREMRLKAQQLAARFRLQERKEVFEDMEKAKSTAMLRAFQVTSKWRKRVLFRLQSGAPTAAFLALLLGSSYLAPLTRHRRSENHSAPYLERVCLCGLRASQVSEDLDLHLFDCFAIRTCTRGVKVRRQHLAAVERVCSSFGVPQILPIVARLSSRLRLAFILGSPRKFPMDTLT
mmetsp:Transcript_21662/g.26054  ORF Transcript_21662/g.26054 Transcript_21662/m.26054 type:complete len:222 (+) Transcript_21662:53-718(+)